MKLEKAAKQLEALGNPTRPSLSRARAGRRHGLPVGQLQEKLRIAASTLSHHLHRLILTGLVTQERQATTLICRANYPAMNSLVGFLVDECCVDAGSPRRKARSPHRASLFSVISMMLEGWNMDKPALQIFPVAVIGGGPVGLAAAAHLLARGLPVKVHEAGPVVGSNLRDWGHVRVFTPGAIASTRLRKRFSIGTAGKCRRRTISDRGRTGRRLSRTARANPRAGGRH